MFDARPVWPLALFAVFTAAGECQPQVARAGAKTVVMMRMRDGVRLATELYFPAFASPPFDVVFVRTPYGKRRERSYADYFTGHGYAVAIQDVRGRFDSEGTWDIFVNERADGYDAVEWLAAQDWSTGNIGMIGSSYPGWAALWAAVEKPPHLKTVIITFTGGEPSRHHIYQNGIFYLNGLDEIHVLEGMRGGGRISNRPWHSRVDHGLPVAELDFRTYGRK
ncbi:MAG: CocE/NonD family hydrolase, partial [Gemmatimonadota bacterium]